MSGKKVQLENRTRAVLLIPVEKGGNCDDGRILRIGDREDVDEKVPLIGGKRERDEAMQPHPLVVLTVEKLAAFGKAANELIDEFVRMNTLRRTELA